MKNPLVLSVKKRETMQVHKGKGFRVYLILDLK